jgi:hypothetical protein
VNAVSLVDQCTGIVFTQLRESLDKTTLADTGRTYTGGLYNNECTMTLFQSYAASETYATLAALVGNSDIDVIVDGGGELFTLTNCALLEMPVVNATLGELSTIDITFVGGTYSVA